jgi:hypothetical protein
LATFTAVQVSSIPYRYIRWFCTCTVLVVTFLFAANWIKFDANRPYEPWRQVSTELGERGAEGDALILYPANVRGPLGYYLDLSKRPILAMGPAQRPEDVTAFLSGLARDPAGGRGLTMVVRYSALIKKDPSHYKKVLDVVRKRYVVEDYRRYGIIRIFKFRRKAP